MDRIEDHGNVMIMNIIAEDEMNRNVGKSQSLQGFYQEIEGAQRRWAQGSR
jgi:hypothetical protein